jgi:hypothetical protein
MIYVKRIILIQKRARLSKEHILTKNRKDRSKTNETKAKNKTNE